MDNAVFLAGKMSYDPLEKTLGEEKVAMCRFVIAVTRKWRDHRSGEDKEFTTHHEVVCYRQLAKHVMESCQTGDDVLVIGRLNTRGSTEEGKRDKITEIVADHVALDLLHKSIPIE